MKDKKRDKKKNSIIEFFAVVIMVIGFFLPTAFWAAQALDESKEEKEITLCATNLQKIMRAVFLFAQDHDDYLPTAHDNYKIFWYDMLKPYVEDIAIFRCPSLNYPIGYGWNVALGDNKSSDTKNYLTKLTEVPNPAKTLLIADSDQAAAGNPEKGHYAISAFGPGFDEYGLNPEAFRCNFVSKRHKGGANVAFVDGHVEWMTIEQIYQKNGNDINNPDYTIWDTR